MKVFTPYLRICILGFIASLGFAPFSLPGILIPIFFALFFKEFQKTQRPSALSFLFALIYFVSLLRWMNVIGTDAWFGLSLICAAWWALAGFVASRFSLDSHWPWKIATVFTATELLRDRIPFGGFGWGQLGVLSVDIPLVSALVPVVGQIGMTFLLFYLSASIAAASKWTSISSKVNIAVVAALLVLIPINSSLVTTDLNRQLRIALVQGGVVHTGLGTFGPLRSVLNKHASLTLAQADELSHVDLVVWPESSSDLDPIKDSISHDIITHVAKTLNKPLLIGANRELPDGRIANVSMLWTNTTVETIYQKRRLVPFGEFLPFRDLISHYTDRASLMPRDFAPGDSPSALQVNGISLDVLICFEVADDGLIFDSANDAAATIVHTNNATYQFLGQSEQQLMSAQMRALETGRSVLSVSTSGLSAVVTPNGTIESSIDQHHTGVLYATVSATAGSTLAMRLHDLEVFVVIMTACGLFVFSRLPRRRVAS